MEIVLVHGAWHGSWCWGGVRPLLEARGLTVRTVDLPSVDAEPGDEAGLSGDAAAVAAVLDAAEAPVLLVGHSYGGMVVSEAAAGRDDVARLVYLCAFMPPPGSSLEDLTGGRPAPWIRLVEDGRTLPDLELMRDVFYGDCDDETAASAIAQLRPMPPAPFVEPVRQPAWQAIPSTYVVCTLDRAIPVELQRRFATQAEESLELEASHSPFFSQPQAVADLLAAQADGA